MLHSMNAIRNIYKALDREDGHKHKLNSTFSEAVTLCVTRAI